jgi:undecaprenyl-diphosphatase
VIAAVVAFRRRQPDILALVVIGVLTSDLLALGGKYFTNRPRPYVDEPNPEPLAHPPLDLSFPSGHAATSFAGAALLATFVPRLAVQFFVLATLIAWSRVYIGVHYPSDVLAGALIGLAVAFVLRRAAVRVRRGRPL